MFKKLLQKFRPSQGQITASIDQNTGNDYLLPLSADQLLGTEFRQALINHIWQHTSLSRDNFQKLYLSPIEHYALLVQQFPASETHHHAYLGGLLDHGLELVGHALKLRQSYLLPPGAAPEDQAVQGDAWTAAIAYGGLLHDIGKIAVDIQVELKDGSSWHPWQDHIKQPYRFRYVQGRDYQLHDMAVGLLCHHIVAPEILSWLSNYQELWSNFLHLITGNYEQAGVLGEIVDKADRVSTAKNIGANPEKAIAAPVNSLQKKLITGLKHLIKTQFNINKTPGNGWLTQEGLWLMSKTTADQLRAYLLSQGFDGIPTKNSVLFDELQSHNIILANPVDDRAIWSVAVSDESGQWQQEFSLIKINAALIWSNDDKPELFKGLVQVIEKEESQQKIPTTTNNEEDITLIQFDQNTEAKQTSTQDHQPTQTSPTITTVQQATNEDEDIDDILSLLGMDQDKDVIAAIETNSDSSDTPITQTTLPSNTIQTLSDSLSDNTPIHKLVFDLETPLTKTSLGEMFISWLKHCLSLHKLKINDKDAKLHLIQNKLFIVSPGIFQRFCFEHPELDKVIDKNKKENWKAVQASFEKMKLHIKRADDLNIWQCSVTGPRKKGLVLKGYLLEPSPFFTAFTPDNNLFIELVEE